MPNAGTPTGAEATPGMVDALAQTEEVVMTKEGPRPLTPEEQASNSPAASTEGAPTETPTLGTEGAPAPIPAPSPAPNTIASVNPSQAPVIDAAGTPVPVSTTPTVAPTIVAPAETVVTAPTSVAETAGLDQLASFVKETNDKAAVVIEEARRVAQGQADRQTALVNKQLEAAKESTNQLRTKMHELEVRDLTPEDRAKAVTAFEQRDEREELDRIREELTVTHRGVFVDSLVLEYSPYGITRETIEASSDVPEAMELYCEQQKSSFLQAKLDSPQSAPVTQVAPTPAATVVTPAAVVSVPAATSTTTPVAAAPAQPVQATAANAPGAAAAAVPAGAGAPSDVGASGAAAEAWKPSEESGAAAMKDNIQHTPWEMLRLP